MRLINFVSIKEKFPLYTKDNEIASNIELLHFNENGFDLVSQKDLYKVGDKALYIQPDTCLPNNSLFKTFISPESGKSKLGNIEGVPSRVRAIKFNMSLEPFGSKIFSNGILYPISVIKDYLGNKFTEDEEVLQELLGLYKYNPPDTEAGQSSGNWIDNMYKTDEENILNHCNNIPWEKFKWYLSEKVDGSSITIGVSENYPEGFIGSRNLMKKIKDEDNNIVQGMFVTYGYPYLKILLDNNINNIAIRGELNGTCTRGSGNSKNPDAKKLPNIKFFSLDTIDLNNKAIRQPFNIFKQFCDSFNIPTINIIEENKEFKSFNEFRQYCENYFNQKEKEGILIEGIVIRNMESTISFKYMNNLYDSKK